MTHSELVYRANKWLVNTKRCGFTLVELVCYSKEVPDVIGWRHNSSYLVECKTSRSDFRADFKKYFRREPERGMGNYRYYMVPPNLISPGDLPERWGLLYVYSKQIRQIVKPVRFRNISRNERPILYSALRRVNLRNDLAKIYNMSEGVEL